MSDFNRFFNFAGEIFYFFYKFCERNPPFYRKRARRATIGLSAVLFFSFFPSYPSSVGVLLSGFWGSVPFFLLCRSRRILGRRMKNAPVSRPVTRMM